MSTEVVVQESELKQEALTVVERASLVKIVDQPSYDSATSLLLDTIKPLRKRWLDYWKSEHAPVTLAYRAYQSVLTKFNEGDDPLEKAEKSIKAEILKWDEEQKAIQQRRQAEEQRQAEEKERADRLRDAVMAEESGASDEEVQAIVAAPLTAVAAPVAPTYEKAKGIVGRDNWKCRVTDMKALCKAIGAGKVPVTYVEANMSALNARAKSDGETMNIPGCKSYNDKIIAGGRR